MEHEHHHKKLYRSNTDKTFLGVCGGLGEYFDVDAVAIRLAWLLAVVFSGIFPGLIAYVLAALLIPKRP
jgi:phage shock protein PspC (stress-responsive transcriptional regulator)